MWPFDIFKKKKQKVIINIPKRSSNYSAPLSMRGSAR